MKNWKTTTLGIFAALLAISALAIAYFTDATLQDAAIYTGGIVGGFILPLALFLTKDHDKDNNEDIEVYSDTGGVGPKRPPKDDNEG